MAVTPYNPIRSPEKHISQEDMWKTLARHTGDQAEVLSRKAVQSPKEKPPQAEPLLWCKPVKTGDGFGYVLSQCGCFSIERRPVKGKPMYMAWRRSMDGQPHEATSLGIRLTRREAEHLCELESAK